MIPSVIASQIQYGIEDYLRTTFPPESPLFKDILDDFFHDPRGMFRGPYLSLKLPYRRGTGETIFDEIPMKYTPYLHQERAFRRLASDSARSTIIATGTGSGKTECFMYPILDYCRRHRDQAGIKAIIIYPMNALATDQAKRFAREIATNPALRGNVTAGLFIGGDDARGGASCMSADGVITNKDTMRENPPSILLTNYRMLDLLLLRPNDFRLWAKNGPETLKYIAVDELHTFDGAQGSDLAALLRRLYARLKIDRGKVCAVGTSATLGDDQESRRKIIAFARDLFGVDFDTESVVTEDVLEPHEFLADSLVRMWPVPAESGDSSRLSPMKYATEEEFLRAQSRLWFGGEWELPKAPTEDDRAELGEMLCQHWFFQNLLRLIKDRPFDRRAMIQELAKVYPVISKLSAEHQENLIHSLFSLISYARRKSFDREGSELYLPFLNVRGQLWLREMSRMVATVEKKPRLLFSDDIRPDHEIEALPLIHCRSCGQIGYLSVLPAAANRFSSDLREIYSAYFAKSPDVHFIFHDNRASQDSRAKSDETRATETIQREFPQTLCGHCLCIQEGEPAECGSCGRDDALIPVLTKNPRQKISKNRVEVAHDCPICGSSESLSIVGARAASLISVAISQLFATEFNQDQKLLTFSDSVQDSAHRAVFYEARTFRFNLRAAIQHVIAQEPSSQESPCLTLAELPGRFIDHWMKRLRREEFTAQFIPPDLQNSEFDAFTELKETKHLPAVDPASGELSLLDKVRRRIHWEILSEYGFRARVGRTLEKTGCSVIALDADRARQWTEGAFVPLREMFREITPFRVRQIILGVVYLMRTRGGISADYLRQYQRDGNTFSLKQCFGFLPPFSAKRAPIFLQERSGIPRFDSVSGTGTAARSGETFHRETIYQKWLVKCLGTKLIDDRYLADDVYRLIFKAGKNAGAIHEERSSRGEGVVWGLDSAAFVIEKNVAQFFCSQTNHHISVAAREARYWENMPSQRFDSDSGHYHQSPSARDSDRDNYYKNLYSHGKVHRVIAREHTGLLKREDREKLENEFIDGKGIAAANTLSCTPTLEMGINVGDLSSVFLCSVPPTKSNYLQRVGRAGRRDGNAINLVVANAKPHDLHFFHEPEEMFSSAVTTPGIFLNAPAVLLRQLTAYCFDRWMEAIEGNTGLLPMELKATLDVVKRAVLDSDQSVDETRFPYTFFDFISRHRTELFDGFRAIFTDVLQSETVASLRDFFFGSDTKGAVEGFRAIFTDVLQSETGTSLRNFFGSDTKGVFEGKILDGLIRAVKTREACKKRINEVTDKLRLLKNKVKDKALEQEEKDLVAEKKALTSRRDAINHKHLFNFFTDEGVLPNYAFPETGVTLRSVLYRLNRRGSGQEDRYKTYTGEYERSARTAISELAPGNEFYVEGRKLTINRIDMTAAEKEEWHFCDNCNHIEKTGEGEKHSAACPRCGSAGWIDGGLKRTVLKMRQVIANQEESTTHFTDDTEQREPKFYDNRIMMDISSDNVVTAYKFNDERLPFGFEYISKVDFREINFGESTPRTGQAGDKLTIGGEPVRGEGFLVCSECGMVQGGDEPRHHVSCKYSRGNADKPIIHCAYLYREFTSEAIRILLPVDNFDYEVKIPSLKAAIYMGLKEKYAGNVDHILITTQNAPGSNQSVRKRFLVLYDQVPGGTGYLKELAQSKENIIELLRLAYNKLKDCPCQSDPEKDGCYGCLYAYKTSREMKRISSREAMEILGQLVAGEDKFERIDSIDDISVNVLFESELEKRFIEAIRLRFQGKPRFRLEKTICGGRPGYLAAIPPKEGKGSPRCYEIIPQYEMGPAQGIAKEFSSRADFLIRAVGNNSGGFKPIAVFTDGYHFHGDIRSGNYRLPTDLIQRMAIARTRKFLSWSVSYDDVCRNTEKHSQPYCLPENFLKQVPPPSELRDVPAEDAFSALTRLLESPDTQMWERLAVSMVLTTGNPELCQEETIEELNRLMSQDTAGANRGDLSELTAFFASSHTGNHKGNHKASHKGNGEYVLWKRHEQGPAGDTFYAVYTRKEDLDAVRREGGSWENLCTIIRFDDLLPESTAESTTENIAESIDENKFKSRWNSLLQLYNLLQFNSHTTVLTSKMIADGCVIPEVQPALEDQLALEDGALRELLEITDPAVHDLLRWVSENKIDLPIAGYELTSGGAAGETTGEVIACAELAWPGAKLAVLLTGDDPDLFTRRGWTCAVAGELQWEAPVKNLLAAVK